MTDAEGRDDVAARLAEIAWDLARRIRTDDSDAVQAWLVEQLPPGEWVAFAMVLAAHIPTDVDQLDLLAWWLNPQPALVAPTFVEPDPEREPSEPEDRRTDEELHTAYVRYRARGVPVDEIEDHIREGHERYLANQRRSA